MFQITDRNGQQKQIKENSHMHPTQIQNYYGAHKNFKTDFKNNKYKNVYNQLIHRKPSQSQHKALYYQDLLISIIKSVQFSFLGKETITQSIQPFYFFGKKAIQQFYWLFLRQKRVIDNQLMINPAMKNKISNFFTLLIDFSCKIAQFLAIKGDIKNSQKIFAHGYKYILYQIGESSTSNLLLLKKCNQFLLHYALQCLNLKKFKKADEILKFGLKIQLNQLIILKYNLINKRNDRKYTKKYAAALKMLTHMYLTLALLYQSTNKTYECSIAVLDAVLLQQLINFYNSKSKKWMWNLQSDFIEQKSKHIQLKRICCTFFNIQKLKNIKTQMNSPIYFNLQQMHYLTRNSDDFTKSIEIIKFTKKYQQLKSNSSGFNIQAQNEKLIFKNNDNKKNHSKITKEVRFNLISDTQQTDDNKNNLIKKNDTQSSEDKLNKILTNQQLYEANQNYQLSKAKQFISKNNSHETKKFKRRTSLINVKNNNNIFLWGENFWQTNEKENKRSKSNFQKIYQKRQLQLRNLDRKLSYNNIALVEANLNKNIKTKLQKYFNLFSKNKNQVTGLKKKKKKQGSLFTKQKQEKPDSKQKIDFKIDEWHFKNCQMQIEVSEKINKLKQKKHLKHATQNNLMKELIQIKPQDESQKKQAKLFQKKNEINSKNYKEVKFDKQKKTPGIKLFKSFLLENKNCFGITKIELFNYSVQIQNQKRYASFSDMQIQHEQKNITKNYQQAKANIQFFKKQIENSNSQLQKKYQKTNKQKQNQEKKLDERIIFELMTESLEQCKSGLIDPKPSNLFATSLKRRVAQVISYY